MRKDFAELRRSIVDLDDYTLSTDDVQALLTFLPNQEELTKVREYAGDRTKLDRPEQFFLELESVPQLVPRVEFWYFSRTFNDRVSGFLPDVKALANGLNQAYTSTKFKKILELVLAIGNYLNGGTANGRAYGFKIEGVIKLADTKAADGKQSLLHFIYNQLKAKYPDLLDWWTELSDVPKASNVSSITVRDESGVIRTGLKKIQAAYDSLSEQDGILDDPLQGPYVRKMKLFLQESQEKAAELDAAVERVNTEFATLCKKFGEDPEAFKWEEFFPLLIRFSNGFEVARKDIETVKKPTGGRVGGRRPGLVGHAAHPAAAPAEGAAAPAAGESGPVAFARKQSMRKARSIRRMQQDKVAASKTNLNQLLDMVNKMKA
eukprot:TRINITY_DN9813_c0_g1_i2.p5 TRINITY_DN9813_c0_g1~~TRINITY_DN9813_c0_g1_i2.p5  ORF type:complete len:377 (-),score=186.05 TRINITY_DN9813_c0_g1_i2:256-1386(-)